MRQSLPAELHRKTLDFVGSRTFLPLTVTFGLKDFDIYNLPDKRYRVVSFEEVVANNTTQRGPSSEFKLPDVTSVLDFLCDVLSLERRAYLEEHFVIDVYISYNKGDQTLYSENTGSYQNQNDSDFRAELRPRLEMMLALLGKIHV